MLRFITDFLLFVTVPLPSATSILLRPRNSSKLSAHESANNGIASGSPLRLPNLGEAGERNPYRGDGYFDIDSGRAKSWQITERQSRRFAWEVFNVTNSVRFDTNTAFSSGVALNNAATSNTLGAYASTLTFLRVQRFSFRYAF